MREAPRGKATIEITLFKNNLPVLTVSHCATPSDQPLEIRQVALSLLIFFCVIGLVGLISKLFNNEKNKGLDVLQ